MIDFTVVAMLNDMSRNLFRFICDAIRHEVGTLMHRSLIRRYVPTHM